MPNSTEITIAVKSTDLGPDKYVRGEVYFTYFEQSRLEHLRRLNIVPEYPPPEDALNYFAIAETQAQYHSPAHFRDILTVRTTTGEVRNRSFRLDFEIHRRGVDGPLVTGYSVQVWLDDQRRPSPIPPTARAQLAGRPPDSAPEPSPEARNRTA